MSNCRWLGGVICLAVLLAWAQTGVTFAATGSHEKRCTILIAGLDQDPKSANPDRRCALHTDTLILLTSTSGSGVVQALHIPRDTRIYMPGRGHMKINGVLLAFGPETLKSVVAQLTGLSVDVLLRVNFEQFRQVVRAVGSVRFFVDRPIEAPEGGVFLNRGSHRLHAEEALAVVRFRHEPLGDIGRVHRQERFLRAAVSLATGLPYPLFSKTMRLLDPRLTEREIALAYTMIHPLKQYVAYSVPGVFGEGDMFSYWLPDHEGVRVIAEKITQPNAVLPAFSCWERARGTQDIDDGRDRSK